MGNEKIRCRCCFAMKDAEGVCPRCGCDDTIQNAPHQLQIGTVLKEQYQIGRVLGQGGFGITYHGWDLYLDIPVAIKEYYPNGMVMREAPMTMAVSDISGGDGSRFERSRERFMREAKMLARFSQVPEIVQVRNFFKANNTAYIVMEYVEGITLKEYVKTHGGSLSPRETFSLVGPIIQTMAKVHKTGIVHRDISADNIMMVPGGAKLLDFGAVRIVADAEMGQELSKSTEAILKPGYAPMEQYQKKGALGPWTDVYAMCATIYFCLTGQVPPDAPSLLMGLETLETEKLDALEADKREALLHGMELIADKRTGSMEQLYEELFSGSKPEPPKPDPPKPDPPKPEPPKPVPPRPEPPKPAPQKQKPTFRGRTAMVAIAAGLLLTLFVAVIVGISGGLPSPNMVSQVVSGENVVSGQCGSSAYWMLNRDTGVLEISGIQMYDFYLDHYDRGEWDKSVERPWVDYLDEIREVKLDNRLYRIGTAAFAYCKNLEKVHFGEELQIIGGDAFVGSGISEIDLPENLRAIEWWAFGETQLREVTIPASVEMIDSCAFAECPNLERVEIYREPGLCFDFENGQSIFSRPGGQTHEVTIWGPGGGIVQRYCEITGLNFENRGVYTQYESQGGFYSYPGDVEGRWYFDSESRFLQIEGEMPTDMKGQWEIDLNEVEPERENVPLPPWAHLAENIHTVYIDEGVTRIPNNAFAHCWDLTDIYLPDTLQSIGFQSFLATNLDGIVIPDSVTNIDSYAFNYCQNLRLVKLPVGLERLQSSVFSVTPNLERVYMGNITELECWEESGQQVTPFNSLQPEHLDDNGVNENAMPENLTIFTPQGKEGDRLAHARQFAEDYGVNYQEGIFGYDNAQKTGDCLFGESTVSWALVEDVLYLTGYGQTPFYFTAREDQNAWDVRQDDKVLIETGAPWYTHRNAIRGVHVAPGITTLNRGAFWDMPNVEFMDLGCVERIYHGAISWCGMEWLEIPQTVFTLSYDSISNCQNLRSLWVHTGIDRIDHGFVRECSQLEELRFWNGEEALDPRCNLFDGPIPENLTVWGREGSPAESYANRNNIPFETITD